MAEAQAPSETYGFDINRVKKGDLNTFITDLVVKRKAQIRKKAEGVLTDALSPHIANLSVNLKGARIEALSEELYALVAGTKDFFRNAGSTWSYMDEFAQRLGGCGMYFTKELHEAAGNSIKYLLNNPGLNHQIHFEKFGAEAWQIIKPLLPMVTALSKNTADLKTTEKELLQVIKLAATGKKAYMDLVALGVDMRAFQPSISDSLPAVIKLSVSPALLNGGEA